MLSSHDPIYELIDLIRPICLPTRDFFFKDDFEGETVTVVGWGKRQDKSKYSYNCIQRILKFASFKILADLLRVLKIHKVLEPKDLETLRG